MTFEIGDKVSEIIGIFTRNAIYTERQRNDGLLTSAEWSSQIFEDETWLKDKLLALLPVTLPKYKPPLLSDKRINEVEEEWLRGDEWNSDDAKRRMLLEAQREADIEHYEKV